MSFFFSQKRLICLVGVIILLAIVLRSYNLEADPDVSISSDPGIYSDEALYSLSARNLALFGTFNPHPKNNLVEALDSPIYTYSEYIALKLFGVNIIALRLPSIIFSFLVLIISYIMMSKLYDQIAGLITVLFLSFNYILIQYNRLALMENLITILLLLSSFFYVLLWQKNKRALLLSGIFFGLSLITKKTSLLFIPGFLFSVALGALENQWWKKSMSNLLYFVAGIICVLAVNEVYLYILIKTDIANKIASITVSDVMQRSKEILFLGTPGDWIKNITQFIISRISASMFEIFFFAYFYSFWVLSSHKGPLCSRRKLELLLIAWIMSGVICLSFFNYTPTRYKIPLVVPICILAAVSCHRILTSQSLTGAQLQGKRVHLIFFLGISLFAFRFIRIGLMANGIALSNDVILILAIIMGIVILLLVKIISRYIANVLTRFKHILVHFLILVFLTHQLLLYGKWVREPVFSIKKGNQLVSHYVQNGIVGGQYAPILCWETNNIAMPLWSRNLNDLNNLGLTHYLDSVYGVPNSDFIQLKQLYPDFLDGGYLLFDIALGNTVVSLYSLKQ